MRTILSCFVAILSLTLAGPAAYGQVSAPAPAAPAPGQPSTPALAPQALPADSADSSGDKSYVLGVGDTIDVSVLGRADFNAHVRIGTDGNVVLPYLGPMKATDRSPGQLAQEVATGLEKGGFFSKPSVRVDVTGVASRFVTVLGSVTTPGLISLDRPFHLSEIVARAGGRNTGGADYVMLTRGNDPPQKFKIADLATGVGDKDPLVQNGDRIYVPAAEAEVFYVQGAVRSPGAFTATADLTVRMALARAGGLSETGSENKVTINRKGKQIKNVKPDDTKVEPGDILTVGEKLF